MSINLLWFYLVTAHPYVLLALGAGVGMIALSLFGLALDWYQSRLPRCTPGNCYCRPSCACLVMERAP